jgi:hypothetical protein
MSPIKLASKGAVLSFLQARASDSCDDAEHQGDGKSGIITAQPSLAPTSTVLEGRLIQMGIRVDW